MTEQHCGHVLAIRILSELYQGLPLGQGKATENSQSVSVPSLLPLVLGIARLDAEGYQPTIVQFKLFKRCKAGLLDVKNKMKNVMKQSKRVNESHDGMQAKCQQSQDRSGAPRTVAFATGAQQEHHFSVPKEGAARDEGKQR
ncbi:hypothetical protein C8F04DRAFT_1181800 [Mycena alexandri]|uniref:Uncharacterized protein n=1 Tax=Mycena alexandri TaxID=1745969 RepID=A0AAD6SY95_9AGAR|nr:hypothetical protein C8F04DRAFT_1181800 [Mycena alexandri]